MSTTQPTVEEQVELGARALFCFHEEWNLDRMFSDSVNAWFRSKEADEKEVVDGLKSQVRAILAALRPPVEVGALVDDPVVAALEAWDTTVAAHEDDPTEVNAVHRDDTLARFRKACRLSGIPSDVAEHLEIAALRRKVALQAAEIERLRRAPEGEVQNAENDAAIWREIAEEREAARAKAVEALEPFVRHYEPWMDEWGDDEQMCTFARVTFGQLRALKALASISPVKRMKTNG